MKTDYSEGKIAVRYGILTYCSPKGTRTVIPQNDWLRAVESCDEYTFCTENDKKYVMHMKFEEESLSYTEFIQRYCPVKQVAEIVVAPKIVTADVQKVVLVEVPPVVMTDLESEKIEDQKLVTIDLRPETVTIFNDRELETEVDFDLMLFNNECSVSSQDVFEFNMTMRDVDGSGRYDFNPVKVFDKYEKMRPIRSVSSGLIANYGEYDLELYVVLVDDMRYDKYNYRKLFRAKSQPPHKNYTHYMIPGGMSLEFTTRFYLQDIYKLLSGKDDYDSRFMLKEGEKVPEFFKIVYWFEGSNCCYNYCINHSWTLELIKPVIPKNRFEGIEFKKLDKLNEYCYNDTSIRYYFSRDEFELICQDTFVVPSYYYFPDIEYDELFIREQESRFIGYDLEYKACELFPNGKLCEKCGSGALEYKGIPDLIDLGDEESFEDPRLGGYHDEDEIEIDDDGYPILQGDDMIVYYEAENEEEALDEDYYGGVD